MMHMMMPIPPVHSAAAFSDVLFWGMIVALIALFLLVTALWIVGNRRIAAREHTLTGEVKEASWQEKMLEPFYSDEQTEVHTPEKELVLHR
ncbi:MAG TPA: hypothetical protein VFA41_07215 [Ktedonobacteraceae bacterium]|jgi:Na+-transporting methylmalonyl-CoA/oxaloacetate decarboxylase gamma subunit|nr:hypothetical protein [Ktedonobacteraceae bacterium]